MKFNQYRRLKGFIDVIIDSIIDGPVVVNIIANLAVVILNFYKEPAIIIFKCL